MLKKQGYICALAVSLMMISTQSNAFLPFLNENTGEKNLEIGLLGGYFRLSPDNRAYAIQQTSATPLSATKVLKVDPKYRFGGGVDVTYGGSYKIKANYFEIANTKRDSSNSVVGTTLTPPPWTDAFANGVSSNLNSRYKFATLAISSPFSISGFTFIPSLGLSYLYLRHNHNTNYSALGGTGATGQINLNSKFNGIGPTFGAFFAYEFVECFSALTNIQFSPLVGDIKGNYSALRTVGVGGVNTNVNMAYKTKSTIVSQFQSELGFAYEKAVNKCVTGNLSLAYRFVKIVGARETNLFVDNVAAGNINNLISNSVLHGPFMRLSFRFKM